MLEKMDLIENLKKYKNNKLDDNLYLKTQILFSYNSNCIEGNMITEKQVEQIYINNNLLSEKDSVIKIDDIREVINHFKLFDYMLDIAEESLTEEMMKSFHKILKEGTSDSSKDWFNIGDYKKLPNEVGGLKTTEPKYVERDMKKLMEWYNSLNQVTINEIIEFHVRFEKIHPFQDGNGRIGRIIMFKECLKHNVIPFIIFDKDKIFYYRGLYQYQVNKEKGFLIDTCLNAQDQYINLIERMLKN